MQTEYAQLITQMHLFRGLTIHGAERLLELGCVKEHAPGELIYREHDAATHVLLVLSGKLRVFIERRGAELLVTDLGAGAILGDIAVLCGHARAASVRVIEQSAVLYWTSDAYRSLLFNDVFLSHRIFAATLRMLVEQEKSLLESLSTTPQPSRPIAPTRPAAEAAPGNRPAVNTTKVQ